VASWVVFVAFGAVGAAGVPVSVGLSVRATVAGIHPSAILPLESATGMLDAVGVVVVKDVGTYPLLHSAPDSSDFTARTFDASPSEIEGIPTPSATVAVIEALALPSKLADPVTSPVKEIVLAVASFVAFATAEVMSPPPWVWATGA